MTKNQIMILKEVQKALRYVDVLIEKLISSESEPKLKGTEEESFELRVNNFLLNMEITNKNAYPYLKEAIVAVMQDMKNRKSMSEKLYPEIAKKYGTTGRAVEIAIRREIGKLWNRKKEDKICGCTVSEENKPGNAEFIVMVANYLK